MIDKKWRNIAHMRLDLSVLTWPNTLNLQTSPSITAGLPVCLNILVAQGTATATNPC